MESEKGKLTPAMKRNSGKIVSWWVKPSQLACPIWLAMLSVTALGHRPHTATTSEANPMIKSMSNPLRASSDCNRSDGFIIRVLFFRPDPCQ